LAATNGIGVVAGTVTKAAATLDTGLLSVMGFYGEFHDINYHDTSAFLMM
jgi:hypothetical protein